MLAYGVMRQVGSDSRMADSADRGTGTLETRYLCPNLELRNPVTY